MITLEIDNDGDLWLVEESEIRNTSRLLGCIDRPGTADRVPPELAGRLAELEAEWAAMVEFRAECRAEVERTFLRAKGTIR